MFHPRVLQPSPEPWFVRELRLIDPRLRVVFGYTRYFMNNWVIERKLEPERYHACYRSLIEGGGPRFVQQPIIDDGDDGKIIGYREFDLAPEWEWVQTIRTHEGGYKPLSYDEIIELRRQYAWNWNHPFSRARYEEAERLKAEQKEKQDKAKRADAWMESYDEALTETGQRVTGKPIIERVH